MPKKPRTRKLVDPETGEIVEVTETYRSRSEMYQLGGSYTPVSDSLMLDILHHQSGFTATDRGILALHVHGAAGAHQDPRIRNTGPLRMPRQEIATFLGVSLRTVAGSIKKLEKAGLLVPAETHGRITYYKVSPRVGSRAGGRGQQEQAQAYRLPSVPKAPGERKAS